MVTMKKTLHAQVLVEELPEERLDIQTTCDYLGVSPTTLTMMRGYEIGPSAVREEGEWYYYKSDLNAWLKTHGPLHLFFLKQVKRKIEE